MHWKFIKTGNGSMLMRAIACISAEQAAARAWPGVYRDARAHHTPCAFAMQPPRPRAVAPTPLLIRCPSHNAAKINDSAPAIKYQTRTNKGNIFMYLTGNNAHPHIIVLLELLRIHLHWYFNGEEHRTFNQ